MSSVCFSKEHLEHCGKSWLIIAGSAIVVPLFLVSPIVKIAASILTMIPGVSSIKTMRDFATHGLGKNYHDLGNILPLLHSSVMGMFNPTSGTSYDKFYRCHERGAENENGFLTEQLAIPLFKWAEEQAQEGGQLLSRLLYFAGTLVVTATKVIELTFGIFMGALSLLMLFGAYEPVNELATRYLQALDGIHHILAGLNGVILNVFQNGVLTTSDSH